MPTELEEERRIPLADCVVEWMNANVNHPYWVADSDTFYDVVDSGPITSPPEQMFACAWCHYYNFYSVSLHPQVQVGTYTLDFCLRAIDHFANGLFPPAMVKVIDRILPSYAIEIDGFKWHDKTPAQAEHDKKRDRYLQSEGYTVLRFAAREVLRDPKACALEVHNRIRNDVRNVYARFSFR